MDLAGVDGGVRSLRAFAYAARKSRLPSVICRDWPSCSFISLASLVKAEAELRWVGQW